MRPAILTAFSLVTIGLLGFACENEPTALPTGSGNTQGGGGNTTSDMGGNTTSDMGGNGMGGDAGMGGNGMGGDGGDGGAGGMVVITDCVEDLNPQEIADDIVISEISVGNYIEVYNPTLDTKSLGGVAYQAFRWCARPDYPTLQSTASNVTVPPASYRTIPWPSIMTVDGTDGEIALYSSAGYANENEVVDFVCWGAGNTQTRKPTAELAGEWTGECAASTTNGVIRRLIDNNGDAAAAWDSTATADPTNCDQP